MARKDFGGFW